LGVLDLPNPLSGCTGALNPVIFDPLFCIIPKAIY
jgi:hypothetical protein